MKMKNLKKMWHFYIFLYEISKSIKNIADFLTYKKMQNLTKMQTFSTFLCGKHKF